MSLQDYSSDPEDVFDAEMRAYDQLPQFARDWLKSNGVSAIDVWNKLCDFQGDTEQLRKWIVKVVIKNS